ncbi:hypothetical protein GCM10027294_54150 [Marinactinospora endophytica]
MNSYAHRSVTQITLGLEKQGLGIGRDMTDDHAELERLPTEELRRRAVSLAQRRWDAGFFWELIRTIPAAEVAAGRPQAGEAGVAHASTLFSQIVAEREGDRGLQEALRPLYLDYLIRHEESS